MSTFVTLHGQQYRVGDGPATPLHLEHIAPSWDPEGWEEINVRKVFPERDYGRGYRSKTGLLLLLTASIEADRKGWMHLSVSHRGGRYPTWDELSAIKQLFCGEERTAYQVHPPTAKHVSMHDKCLHLWCPLDGAVTPDFSRGGETI